MKITVKPNANPYGRMLEATSFIRNRFSNLKNRNNTVDLNLDGEFTSHQHYAHDALLYGFLRLIDSLEFEIDLTQMPEAVDLSAVDVELLDRLLQTIAVELERWKTLVR